AGGARAGGPSGPRAGWSRWFQRTRRAPMPSTFDAPDGVLCTVRREKSNTPLQALTLLNDAVFVECARALGRRILAESAGPTERRLDYAFRLCLARPPTAKEREVLSGLHRDLTALARSGGKEVARLLGSDAIAVPDRAEAAAWVALARALMNLDEFVTRE